MTDAQTGILNPQSSAADSDPDIETKSALQRRDAVLEAVSFAAQEFMTTESWENCVNEVLARLGKAEEVSRIYVFRNHEGENGQALTSQLFEWVAPQVEPQIDNPDLQGFNWADMGFMHVMETLKAGQVYSGHVADLSEAEQEVFSVEDIKSIMLVPIFVNRKLWGLIGFDECLAEREWSRLETDALMAAASILGAAIHRQQTERTLRRRLYELEVTHSLTQSLSEAVDVDSVFETLVSGLKKALRSDRASVLLFDSDRILRFKAWRGLSDAYRSAVEKKSPLIPDPDNPQPVFITSVREEPRFAKSCELLLGEGIQALACYPLKYCEALLGKFTVYYDVPHEFDEDEIRLGNTIARNIAFATLRKQAEERLRQSEERYRDLFENASDLIQCVAPDGSFLYVNSAWKKNLGYSHEELIDLKLADVIHPKCRDHCEDLFQNVLSGADVDQMEVSFITKDGREIELEGNVNGWRENGKAIATRSIFHDITERKQVERMKDEFVSTVSHELRTPLTSITGSLSLVKRATSHEISKDMKSLIDIAARNSQRLAHLIDDVLDIQRIDSGMAYFNLTSVSLKQLVEESIADNSALGDPFGISFEIIECCKECSVLGDYDRLMQVVTNLLSNAAKYSNPNTCVNISIQRLHRRLRVSIRDTGPGIPEELRDQIFQRFCRLDHSLTRERGGTGLGLSIAKAIVEKHGGSIGCDSEVGVGSTFYFDLPASRSFS